MANRTPLRPTRRPTRRRAPNTLMAIIVGLPLVALFTAVLIGGSAGTAHAADGYRYWNYFHFNSGELAFAQEGPSDFKVEDGDVEAYRFGVSATAAGLPPRADLEAIDFEAVCSDTEASANQQRIAVLIDYGTDSVDAPAPRADCAVVAGAANGLQVLDAVADVRSEGGLVCALDGYPAEGCGESVPDAKPSAEPTVAFELPTTEPVSDSSTESGSATAEDSQTAGDSSNMTWPLVAIAVLVVAIAAGALALSKRNRA